jgi:hypothetical protein
MIRRRMTTPKTFGIPMEGDRKSYLFMWLGLVVPVCSKLRSTNETAACDLASSVS